MSLAVVVPVRAFDLGKSRLADSFDAAERETLARAMAEIVVAPRHDTGHDTGHDTDWFVVCDDDGIAEWARGRNARPINVSARGLNAALDAARADVLTATSAAWIAIAHADLPLAHDLVDIVRTAVETRFRDDEPDVVLIAPDRHRDGSNVVVVPRQLLPRWEFRYGPGSFGAHLDLAHELGVAVTVIDHPHLTTDVDTVDDLALVRDFITATLPHWSAP